MSRTAVILRETTETKIKLELCVDGEGKIDIETGIGFFDHMLALFCRHGFFDLSVQAKGDLQVDTHHTVEDVGIVLGKALADALGTKEGIKRYGSAFVPMDESLALCVVDISGRPCFVFDGEFTVPRIGEMDTEMIEEFFRAFCLHSGITLHIRILAGGNNHHKAEACFKAFGRALREAASTDGAIRGVLSTKGMLD